MSEHKIPIPSMIYNAAVGGHVTNSQQIIDENENKEQSQINTEVKELSRLKLTMAYTMTVGDTVVCTAESVHCFVSKSGRPINIQKEYPDFYQAVCDASR